jgi:hypothetical protein
MDGPIQDNEIGFTPITIEAYLLVCCLIAVAMIALLSSPFRHRQPHYPDFLPGRQKLVPTVSNQRILPAWHVL